MKWLKWRSGLFDQSHEQAARCSWGGKRPHKEGPADVTWPYMRHAGGFQPHAAVHTSHYKYICVVSHTVGLASLSVVQNTVLFLSIYRKYRTPIYIYLSFDMLLSIRLTIKIYALCHTRSVLLLLVLDRTPFFSCRFIEKYRTPIYISIVRYAAVDTSHYKDIRIVSYTVGLAASSVGQNTVFFLSIYRKISNSDIYIYRSICCCRYVSL